MVNTNNDNIDERKTRKRIVRDRSSVDYTRDAKQREKFHEDWKVSWDCIKRQKRNR